MDPYNYSTPISTKLPILDTRKFEQWRFRIQQYLQHERYSLWEVIEFGDSYKAPPEETAKYKGLAGEVSSSTNKKGRIMAITAEDMLQAIVSHLEFMDVPIEQDDLNQNFLTSLAPEWLVSKSLDDVYNHLKVYKPEEDEGLKNHALMADEEEVPIEYALMSKSSSSSDNEVYDDSFCSKSCRKNTENLNTKISKLNEELSDCETDLYNYKRGLSQVEARLVEFKENEIKYCKKIRVFERDIELKDNKIEYLRNELEEMGLPEFVDDTVIDYTRPTPSIDVSKSVSGEQEKRWKSNNSSFFEQGGSSGNVVSKPMIKFVKESGCPNATKVNNTENARKPTVKYAEMHMTSNISYLSEYEPFNRGYVSFSHGRGKITSKGSIKTGDNVANLLTKAFDVESCAYNVLVKSDTPYWELIITCFLCRAGADTLLSTLHFLKILKNSLEVLKVLKNSLEVLKVLKNSLEVLKVLQMELQENSSIDKMSANVARSHDGDGGGEDLPLHTMYPTVAWIALLTETEINTDIQRHLQKSYNTNKVAFKAQHWVIDPTTGTYNVEKIRRERPENIKPLLLGLKDYMELLLLREAPRRTMPVETYMSYSCIMTDVKRNMRTWTTDEDTKLVDALMEIRLSRKYTDVYNNKFRTGYLEALERMLNVILPNMRIKADPHLKSRLKTLRNKLKIVNDMLVGKYMSRFSWDHERLCVVVDDHVWDKYIKDLRILRSRSRSRQPCKRRLSQGKKNKGNGSRNEGVLDEVLSTTSQQVGSQTTETSGSTSHPVGSQATVNGEGKRMKRARKIRKNIK
uniref:Myb/SANT-like domain-containing protein n=1 Tax=Tanacetum cinerariifolium TaxID=118510 RepID=A0A6L2MLU1_TANCI|nr:hypothetical protein [Tanacetum cinerariifolium]